jgi:hypothetical protein
MRYGSAINDKLPPKKNLSPAVKRTLIGLLLFLLLTAVSDIQVWLIKIPLDVNDSDSWIIAPFKWLSILVFYFLFFIFAIFNVVFNLVLSRKSGSIALLHFFIIVMVISFSMFASSEWEEKRGCVQENLSFTCWVENSLTSINTSIDVYIARLFRLIGE